MKTTKWLLLLFLGIISSCNSPAKRLQGSYNADSQGMIVGTICIEKKLYNGYKFMYGSTISSFNDNPKEKGEFEYKYDTPDFQEKGKSYFLFTIVKPKGSYKFYKIKIFDNSRIDQNFIEIPITINFDVVEGKTTYFGQLNVNTQKKEYTVENQIDRDREWFSKKRPDIKF